MSRTNSPVDEAYATYSGLDLTIKDQSVLESCVQASSTPRRVSHILSKTLHEKNQEDYSTEQLNTFGNNSVTISEQLKQIQNNKKFLETCSIKTDSQSVHNEISCYCNSKCSAISCYYSVHSNDLDYTCEIENYHTQAPLDLRLKSASKNVNTDCNNTSNSTKTITNSPEKYGMFAYASLSLSNQMTQGKNYPNTDRQPGNSFNIKSLLRNNEGINNQSSTNSECYDNLNGTDNCAEMQTMTHPVTSKTLFDQLLVNYLQMINPLGLNSLLSNSNSTQIPNERIVPQVESNVIIPCSPSLSTDLNTSVTRMSPVKKSTRKLNPAKPTTYEQITEMTNQRISEDTTTEDSIGYNLKQMDDGQSSTVNTYALSCSSISSEDDTKIRCRRKSGDLGKTPIILYYPEPSDSKKRIKAMLERNDPCLKYVNDGAAIRNPFAVDRKVQLIHLTSLLCVKLDNNTYLCKGCSRTTRRLRPMQQHLLSHSASKFNLCVQCLKGFNDKYDMKRHTRKHTLVRPYVCPECKRSFSQRCSLEGHRRKIHKIQLNYTPNQRREIVRVCETCGYSCSKLYDMLQHTLNNHPNSNCLPRLQRQFMRHKEKIRNTSTTSNEDIQACSSFQHSVVYAAYSNSDTNSQTPAHICTNSRETI
ncbi:unnamed protein product [Trichobilharzia regenti]|uniref:C2H2-type domain-containing protein n=1 Tax=Trichobilharzia regenti TaxID=157069 RepID=A0A183VRX8_TRIRE|nr:unnamed protein product [Trichobilharzia regenti]VDP99113.1 unnamed protein product [Trichobilharzia regenti]